MNVHIEGERLGPMLRRLRAGAGLSEEELAIRLNRLARRDTLSRTEVWRWEVEYEGRTVGPYWLPHLADTLDVPVGQLQAARAVSRAVRRAQTVPSPSTPADVLASLLPPDEPLAPSGTTMGRRVGTEAAEAILRRTHGLRLADDVLAGGDLIEPVVRELRAALDLFNSTCHTEAVGRALLVGIAELAQLAGWVASDADGADAGRYFRLGIAAARQAEDPTLLGLLTGTYAYYLSNTGETGRAVDLAHLSVASTGPGSPARARTSALDRLAWVTTQAGQAQEALRAVEESAEALSDYVQGDDTDRRWLYWVGEDETTIMRARVYTELHRPLRAVPLLRRVLEGYDATHTRELALYLSWLAVALVDANEPEEAATTARRVLELSAAVPSARAQGRGRVVLDALRRHQDVPEVADVLTEWGHA
jgi:tetratricopeptide (TPR) repeat protein